MTTSDLLPGRTVGLEPVQAFQKRAFDLVFAVLGLLAAWWLILLAWIAASIDTRSNGFFIQKRVGRHGKIFRVVKMKTMRPVASFETTVTRRGDPRITPLGAFFRRTKIDELPQLWNVLLGDMSFVGPRPDVPGFADKLQGEERAMLAIRPGITGPATLKYRNEEELLAGQNDPEAYNRDVIWPDKVRINLEYIRDWSLRRDIQYILETVFH
ncbi:sugar transferase [Marinobacter sp. Arc7-DN-1]|uniref:sugar transferase n=1 Tax=Marinobacter sp. Arc7-DN-1 TaxID=2304594 RepID=UPI000E440C2B|nr:sugar transferase [Marinobacter sp. Arc7-DN-1]AXS82509.1 sugar transferase [Marinobacter sp. Arc7-DN-1]